MIPIILQVLHGPALVLRSPADDSPNTAGFSAALAAEHVRTDPALEAFSAEACLLAGIATPAQPPLIAQSGLTRFRVAAAEATLTEPLISPAHPTAFNPAEEIPSDLAATSDGPPNMALSPVAPLLLPSDNLPQSTNFQPAEIGAGTAPEPKLAFAADKLRPTDWARDALRAGAATGTDSDAAFFLPWTEPHSGILPRQTIPTPTIALLSQVAAAKSGVLGQLAPQQIKVPADTACPAVPPALHRTAPLPPESQTYATNDVANQTPEVRVPPIQTWPVQASQDQVPTDQTPDPPVPGHPKTSISRAESAWQTRLQGALPLIALSKPDLAVVREMLHPVQGSLESPHHTDENAPEVEGVDVKRTLPPNPLPNTAPTSQAPDRPNLGNFKRDTKAPVMPAVPTSAHPSSDTTSKPVSDAAAARSPSTALADQATLRPDLNQIIQHANPVSPSPIPPHHMLQTQSLASSFATSVPAQLLHHTAAAKADSVDVLLQPEELGHIKFQIQQQGETVRILLTAERPETVELLRRHSEQLLQEFRQAGFSQASLNFGQWGQQQKAPAAPPDLVSLLDAEVCNAPATLSPPSVAPLAPSGQGLNLRL